MNIKKFESGNVIKFVYIKKDAVYESVLYKYGSYKERTVMCISVQSGCPVSCVFCGTGKNFIRNLTYDEIINQVFYMVNFIYKTINFDNMDLCKKFQIMFMSMGEPMLNWNNVNISIRILNNIFKNSYLLVSTIGVNDEKVFNDIIYTSEFIDKIGLQFSLHSPFDKKRNKLIPYKKKYNVIQLRKKGIVWSLATGRKVYLNYCLANNDDDKTKYEIMESFNPKFFNITLSVICDPKNGIEIENTKTSKLQQWLNDFKKNGYNTRIFNPDGQDDIGAGCGQLWHVQEWLKNNGGNDK